MEEAFYETTILRQFVGLSLERIPDATTILNFRRLLEKHEPAAGILGVINGYLGDRGLWLRQGPIVDATLIKAPSSTKNKDGNRDPAVHQTKKGNQYYFGSAPTLASMTSRGWFTAANVREIWSLLIGFSCSNAAEADVGKKAGLLQNVPRFSFFGFMGAQFDIYMAYAFESALLLFS